MVVLRWETKTNQFYGQNSTFDSGCIEYDIPQGHPIKKNGKLV